jgi:hypothetical protein
MPYTPAYNVFNGSTFEFDGTAVGGILSIRYSENGEQVKITGEDDFAAAFGVALGAREFTVQVVGGVQRDGIIVGQRGSINVVFNTSDDDFDPSDLPVGVITRVEQSGTKNGAIVTEISFIRGRDDESGDEMIATRSGNPFMRGHMRYMPTDPWGAGPTPLTADGEINEEWTVVGAKNFTGYAEDEAQGPLRVFSATGLPALGSEYWEDSNWLCSRYENIYDTAATVLTDLDDPKGTVTWKLTLIYVPDPTKRPVEVYFSTNRVMKVVDKDLLTGASIANSRGDLFNPEVQEARAILRMRVIKRCNLSDMEAIDIRSYVDHVNEVDWSVPPLGTVPEATAFCVGINAPLVKEPIWHFQVEFEFDIEDPKGTFQRKLLDCGYQYNGADGHSKLFASDEGYAHNNIGLLDGSGGKLTDPTSPVFLDFDTKPTADFTELGLF